MSYFAPSGPSPQSSVTVLGGSQPTIANIALPSANTEVSYSLPANTVRFQIRLRAVAELKIAYLVGTSGTTFRTIYAGETYEESGLSLTAALPLYFQATKSSQTAEIISWAV